MTIEAFSCIRGSLTIRGHVYREKEGKLPAVILSHPFMTSEKMCGRYARTLAGLGYAAFTYDFCGGGPRSRSDGRTEDMTVLTEVEDLCAVMDYVRSREDVNAAHLSLMGQSQGGAVSAIAAARHPNDVEKLVLFYPALCIPDDARAGNLAGFRFDPDDIPDIIARFPMKLGGEYAKCMMHVDMYQEISGYDGPVLLVHGTKDGIVNVSYAEKARQCYAQCTCHIIENGGHGFMGKHNREATAFLTHFMALDGSHG